MFVIDLFCEQTLFSFRIIMLLKLMVLLYSYNRMPVSCDLWLNCVGTCNAQFQITDFVVRFGLVWPKLINCLASDLLLCLFISN